MRMVSHKIIAVESAYLFGSFVNWSIFQNTSYFHLFCFFAFAYFGGLLPDIDEPESSIGRRLRIFSSLLHTFGTKHRGWTHNLLVVVVFLVLLLFVIPKEWILFRISFLGMTIGYFSHQIADLMTSGGIKNWIPFLGEIRLLPKGMIRTGEGMELVVVMFYTLICITVVIIDFYDNGSIFNSGLPYFLN